MTFTSWQFGVFAAIVFTAYYLPPLRAFQVQLLVSASLFFYGYGQPELLALLAVAVFGTYLFLVLALRNRRVWLPAGIAFNLALLAFFKYKLLFIDPASASLVDFAPVDFLLNPGNYMIDITLSGYKPVHRVINLERNGKIELNENMEPQ